MFHITLDTKTLLAVGTALIFAGVLIVLGAFLWLFFSNIKREGKVKGGGVIIVGPFPIVFGTDKESIRTVLLLSLLLTILAIVVMVLSYLLSR